MRASRPRRGRAVQCLRHDRHVQAMPHGRYFHPLLRPRPLGGRKGRLTALGQRRTLFAAQATALTTRKEVIGTLK